MNEYFSAEIQGYKIKGFQDDDPDRLNLIMLRQVAELHREKHAGLDGESIREWWIELCGRAFDAMERP